MPLSTSLELMSRSSLMHAPLDISSEVIFCLGKIKETDLGVFTVKELILVLFS